MGAVHSYPAAPSYPAVPSHPAAPSNLGAPSCSKPPRVTPTPPLTGGLFDPMSSDEEAPAARAAAPASHSPAPLTHSAAPIQVGAPMQQTSALSGTRVNQQQSLQSRSAAAGAGPSCHNKPGMSVADMP